MNPIDPSTLPGLPAPFWFVQLFKIAGFVLHCIPMSLWLVGFPMALFLYLVGRRNAQRYSTRLLVQMPIIMALGINFGIVPLLFIQTGYYKAFYTSTILMAVHWFSIFVLVGIAYYAVYGSAIFVKRSKRRGLLLCGFLAVLCLTAVSLIFAGQWTFMALPDQWVAVFDKKSIGGAATGLGTWWRDPVVYLRWIAMVGIAFTTLAFWTVFDAWVLCRTRSFISESEDSAASAVKKKNMGTAAIPKLSKKDKKRLKKAGGRMDDYEADETGNESDDEDDSNTSIDSIENYRRWALSLATCFSWFGFLLAGGALSFYYYKIIQPECHDLAYLFESNWKYLPIGTLCSLLVMPLILTLGKWGKIRGALLVLIVTLWELVILAAFATVRQLIQNGQLAAWLHVAAIPERVDWGPLYTFLGVFAFTFIVVLWMIRQMVVAGRKQV